ncbi:MAG: dihydroxy-acid dehydratase [Microthrixaceae bacterium]
MVWRSWGNLAGGRLRVIKAAGIDEELFTFSGPARVVESQEAAVETILEGIIQPGEVLWCATRVLPVGPAGAGDAVSQIVPEGRRAGQGGALITDGRFSGGTSGLHRPRLTRGLAGGVIGLVEDGDLIEIDVHGRRLNLAVADDVLAERRAKMDA